MKSPFAVNYTDVDSVVEYAKSISSAKFPMYVIKHPSRDNYNITGNLPLAILQGHELVWSSK